MTLQSDSFRAVQGLTPEETLQKRQSTVTTAWEATSFDSLFQSRLDLSQVMAKNCENMIGSVEVPVGLAGPTTTQFHETAIELWVPLATTEGALVASVNRGMKLLQESDSVQTITENKGMSRAPVFVCTNGTEAKAFCDWLMTQQAVIDQHARELSAHLRFLNVHTWVQGRQVFARFHFDTQEAMGMNMVTINLEKIIEKLLLHFPQVQLLAISSNVCADKKPSSINNLLGRGWWVQTEAFMSDDLIEKRLHATSQRLIDVHIQKNLVGSHLAGSLAQNAHIANIAAAFYLATGQDIAHTVNASLGITSLEKTDDGIYAAVTLPEVDVGTVGGGTQLAPQKQARGLICQDENVPITAELLAATLGVGCLAGELSVLGAIATKQLGKAHQELGRGER